MLRVMTVIMVLTCLVGCTALPWSGSGGGSDLAVCRQELSLEISRRSALKLRDVATEVSAQRQTLAEVEGYVGWMSNNLSAYGKYIDAGKVVSAIARVLPVPYAGQASLFTKFVSSALLSLESASVSLNNYLKTSQQFVAKVDAIGLDAPSREAVSDAVFFADTRLQPEMHDVRNKLRRVTELSSSTLAFLQALEGYARSTDEYLNKTKSFFLREREIPEKGFLTESAEALKGRAAAFEARLKQLDESSKRCELGIKTLVGYGELSRELAERHSSGLSAPGGIVP